jgi:hypothetical protein
VGVSGSKEALYSGASVFGHIHLPEKCCKGKDEIRISECLRHLNRISRFGAIDTTIPMARGKANAMIIELPINLS